MQDKTEIGEYVKTKDGLIGKLEQINKEPTDESITYIITDTFEGFLEEIVKHSKDITDLIEDSDILQVEVSEEWTIKKDMIRFAVVGQTYTISEIKECLENGLFKIKQIVTHEQFENYSYKVGV